MDVYKFGAFILSSRKAGGEKILKIVTMILDEEL